MLAITVSDDDVGAEASNYLMQLSNAVNSGGNPVQRFQLAWCFIN